MADNIFHILSKALKVDVSAPENIGVVDFITNVTDGTITVKNSEGVKFILAQEDGWITAEEVGRTIRWGDEDYWDYPDLARNFNTWGTAQAF